MAVTFHIPGPLRVYVNGESRVEIDCSPRTAGEALQALWERYPGLRFRITTEQGHVREHINIFVGENSIRDTGGLGTAVKDGCEISIIPAVSGGTGTEFYIRSSHFVSR